MIKGKILDMEKVNNIVLKRVLEKRICNEKFHFHNDEKSSDFKYKDSHADYLMNKCKKCSYTKQGNPNCEHDKKTYQDYVYHEAIGLDE